MAFTMCVKRSHIVKHLHGTSVPLLHGMYRHCFPLSTLHRLFLSQLLQLSYRDERLLSSSTLSLDTQPTETAVQHHR